MIQVPTFLNSHTPILGFPAHTTALHKLLTVYCHMSLCSVPQLWNKQSLLCYFFGVAVPSLGLGCPIRRPCLCQPAVFQCSNPTYKMSSYSAPIVAFRVNWEGRVRDWQGQQPIITFSMNHGFASLFLPAQLSSGSQLWPGGYFFLTLCHSHLS